MSVDIGRELQAMNARLERLERSARLSHASIDDTSVQIRDSAGGLKGLLGVQADGTAAVNMVNGVPPPQPSDPIVASVLGGVTVSWDGLFADAAVMPLDWQRVEVHAAIASSYDPVPATLQGTIETAQGATVVVPCDTPVYVRLLARNTSGTASVASAIVGPFGPTPVVATDLLDGIVTELKLADDAVTEAKIAVGAVGTTALQDGAVLADKLADAAVEVGKIANGAVLLNTLGGPLADTAGIRYADYFRDPNAWAQLSAAGGGTWDIDETATGTPSGGGTLTVTGEVQLAAKALIPQDTDALYRVLVRVRATAQDPAGVATVYLGAVGVAEDGVTLVNRAGAALNTSQHYACSSGGSLGTADGWKTYVGWIQGHSAPATTAPAGPATDPRVPEVTHADVRFLRPMVWLNFGRNTSAVMEVEAVTVEAVRTGTVGSTNLITGSVTAGAIATDAVTAGKVAADAITAREIAANAVTAAEVAAGAITTDKLTVTGGANLLSDPSFEGAYSASLVVGDANWSIDATGNGSAKSLKVNAVAGSATTRSKKITTVPILPADQLYLAVDYLTSSDYTATAQVKFYARWEDSAGATLSFGSAVANPPTLGGSTWTRISFTATAPATAVQATIWAESYQAQAGTLNFDNAVVRPVLAGTQIQDGVITTGKIAALTILAGNIAADAVAAGKIAADAVTAREIAALSVTASEIAANTITAGKLAAGSVDAAAISATAITGKTITGGTIDGTTITGGILQTATSGERVAVNEAGQNKIIVYDSTGAPVGEFSHRGVRLIGNSGALLMIDPDATYPQISFNNAANTNTARMQVIEPVTGDANLESFCGPFAGSTFSDMTWRQYLGRDFAVIERLRAAATGTVIGGRLAMLATEASIGFKNTVTPAEDTTLAIAANLATLIGGRLEIAPNASALSALYVNAPSGYTGNLLRLLTNAVEKFRVDKDGNTTVAGDLAVSGVGHRETKYRTTDDSRTSTVTATADSQITFPVVANGVYQLDGYLKYSGAFDFLMGWTFPSGTLGEWQGLGNGTTVASATAGGGTQLDVASTSGYSVRTESVDIGTTRTYGGIGTTVFGVQVRAFIRVSSTAGTFALRWAQGTSNATSTFLYTDSHLRLERVA